MRRGQRVVVVAVLAISISTLLVAAVPDGERAALLAIYDATNGAQWTTRTGWGGVAGTECEWFGVTCDDGKSTVIALSLRENGLRGTLPPQIGDLANLTDLRLAYNDFTGPLPAAVFSLTKLRRLDCDGAGFSGMLPRDVGRLQNLETLWLYGNQLTGEIPPEITSLSALHDLDVSDNSFSGAIPPDIDRLGALDDLDLSGNQLEGAIPAAVGRMRSLTYLNLGQNALSGPVPPLDALTALGLLNLSGNRLSGPLPDLRALTGLSFIGLSQNRFSGPIPDVFDRMPSLSWLDLKGNALTGPFPRSVISCPELQYLFLGTNQLSGPIPSEIANLKALDSLEFEENQFSGPLPASIGEMTNLQFIHLFDNELSGPILPQIGNLTALQGLMLEGNRFTGPIPPEIGRLQSLEWINISANDLSGEVPKELLNLTNLWDAFSNFDFNRLYTNDATLLAFLNRKNFYNKFDDTQTVAPTNVKVTAATDRSVSLEWTPIRYWWGDGGYQVSASLTPGGPGVALTSTPTKWDEGAVLHGLASSTTYYITVRSVTYPWYIQRNVLISEPSPVVQAVTGPRTIAPADVAVTAQPRGLVQIDGVAQNEDSFALTNFGDAATAITLHGRGDFFTFAPAEFTLAAGATRTIAIQSVSRPAGSYYGGISATGEGASEGEVSVSLLSAQRPVGTVNAEPVAQRVEIVGTAGTTSLGTVTFRNTGSGTLNGIAIADVPWIIPSADRILIFGGGSASIPFIVDRSKRPEASGSMTGNLSLVYVAGIGSPLTALDTGTTSGVKVSTVTVIDVARTQVGPATIPSLAGNEVAYFIPAVAAKNQAFGSMVTDLAIVNAFGTKPLTDLRLYFTPAAATQAALASLGAIAGTQSINLANVVNNVYGSSEPAGTLQVRTANWDAVAIAARLLSLGSGGTYSGEVPVFRSDRSAEAGAQTVLTGLREGGGLHATIFIQETNGYAALAHVEMLDASGERVAARDVPVAAFGLVALGDVVNDRSVTAVITTANGLAGRLAAHATIVDGASGESWSIVDWSRQRDFKHSVPLRLPLAGRAAASSARRRSARHGSATHGKGTQNDGVAPGAVAQLSIFNPLDTEGLIGVGYVTASRTYEKDVDIGAKGTAFISDVAAFTGAPATGEASLLVEPKQGEIVVTGRMSGGSAGTALPVVAALSGLRLGKTAIFCGLEDSTSSTVAAASPGTYRTTYGFLETGNAPVAVRVTVLLSDGRSLVSAVAARRFELAAGQLLVVPDMVRSIIGAGRDRDYPDLHNLQLQVEVTGGSGAVVPFVMMTDNATGDSVMRVE